ncbi:hypothetical protein KSF_107880 [Reticulibacter mediterranei]|uniref:Uncharacterized protein n=1 Tax=Reticulibacter mediterranei TaxID=2778369 RepID=A0A8J3J1S9_9CHLR|nr:hypothetical protein [Reticulibacter mediterranei]GHP00741.1 hypothetical protein KSF_107880 [Reticulibacter mediterranei]
MAMDTARLMHLLWNTSEVRAQWLSGFFHEVDQGTSREEIDQWLERLINTPRQRARLQQVGIDLAAVHWERVTEFLCACFYASQSRGPLPDLPPDEQWEASTGDLQGLLAPYPQRSKAIKNSVPMVLLALEQKLLAHGGTRMVYVNEPDLAQLLERGEVFEGRAKLVRGEPGHCHSNAARLWNEQRAELSIATGYALSEDGLWRQHSWLVRTQPKGSQRQLIETTIRRIKYYGFLLTEEEAEAFSRANR